MTAESSTKLAEKLGFRIRNGYKIVDRRTFKATDAEIALWNLCLELSAAGED